MKTLIISDIHGNIVSLKEIISREDFDNIWFLGDLLDYGPEPDKVLDELRSLNPDVWIMGNHDYANAFNVDCKCGEKTHDLSVYTRENITKKKLSEEDIKFLRKIPIKKEIIINNKSYYFVHGCPSDPLYGYMFDFMPECMRNEFGGEIKVKHLLFGHTHFPLIGRYENLIYINPGSVGQPRDGDPRASYAVYDGNNFEIKRIKYDVEKTVKKLKEMKIREDYLERLIKILRLGKV